MPSTITISRDSGYADMLRNYRVMIDGTDVAGIGDGETRTSEYFDKLSDKLFSLSLTLPGGVSRRKATN